jgi:hypothetical protein
VPPPPVYRSPAELPKTTVRTSGGGTARRGTVVQPPAGSNRLPTPPSPFRNEDNDMMMEVIRQQALMNAVQESSEPSRHHETHKAPDTHMDKTPVHHSSDHGSSHHSSHDYGSSSHSSHSSHDYGSSSSHSSYDHGSSYSSHDSGFSGGGFDGGHHH